MSWFAAKLLFVKMSAAQEGNVIEDVFLEPLQPKIDDWRDVECEQLGNDQAADDDQTEWPTRGAIGADSERDRQCAHERCQGCHDNWTKAFNAGFMNRFAPLV